MENSKERFLKKNEWLLIESDRRLEDGRYSEALSLVNKAIKELTEYLQGRSSRKGLMQLTNAYFIKANIYLCQDEVDKSLKCINFFRELIRRSGVEVGDSDYRDDWLRYSSLLWAKGNILKGKERIPEALKNYQESVDILAQLHDLDPGDIDVKELLLKGLIELLIFCFDFQLYEEHSKYAEEYLKVFDADDINLLTVTATPGIVYGKLAQSLYNQGKISEAKALAETALDVLKKECDYYDSSVPVFALASDYFLLGEIEEDSKQYRKAREYFKTVEEMANGSIETVDEEGFPLFVFLKLKSICSRTELSSVMGDSAGTKEILESLNEEMLDHIRLLLEREESKNYSTVLVLRYFKLCIEATLLSGNYVESLPIFDEYTKVLYDALYGDTVYFDTIVSCMENLMGLLLSLSENAGIAFKEQPDRDMVKIRNFINHTLNDLERLGHTYPSLVNRELFEELKKV